HQRTHRRAVAVAPDDARIPGDRDLLAGAFAVPAEAAGDVRKLRTRRRASDLPIYDPAVPRRHCGRAAVRRWTWRRPRNVVAQWAALTTWAVDCDAPPTLVAVCG